MNVSEARQLFDVMRRPVLVVDATLTILVRNRMVDRLEKNEDIGSVGAKLVLGSGTAMERLRKEVERIASDDTREQPDVMIRWDRADGSVFLLIVRALNADLDLSASDREKGVALVVIKTPEGRVDNVVDVMQELYGTPPAEARFVAALAQGKTIRHYAVEAGLSETYVRELSKCAMQRVGVNRQSELVRRVMSLTC